MRGRAAADSSHLASPGKAGVWRQVREVAARVGDVVRGDLAQLRDLFGGQRAHHFTGGAQNERPVGNDLALGNQGVRADEALPAYDRVIEDERLDADQGPLANGAA